LAVYVEILPVQAYDSGFGEIVADEGERPSWAVQAMPDANKESKPNDVRFDRTEDALSFAEANCSGATTSFQ
jgi:hypothetical protein